MQWISVKEKVPENDDHVLVYNPKDGISLGEYDSKTLHGYYESDGSYFVTNDGWETRYDWAPYMSPTHWMPLPDAPIEPKTEKNTGSCNLVSSKVSNEYAQVLGISYETFRDAIDDQAKNWMK